MKPPSIRSVTTLYGLDRPFARISNFIGIVLVITVTLGWFSSQIKAVVGAENPGIETQVLTWVPAAGLGTIVLALCLLLRRYNWINNILSHGVTIKGVIKKIDVKTSRLPAEKHAPWTPRLLHSYDAVIDYDCGGVGRRVRLKLPSLSVGTTIAEGAEVDLIVLETAPSKPLLRTIFQNWAHTYARRPPHTPSQRLP